MRITANHRQYFIRDGGGIPAGVTKSIWSEGGAAIWTAWNRVVNRAIQQGVTIAASAGNGFSNLNGSLATLPADLPNVISVGATGIRPLPAYPQEGGSGEGG